MLPEVHIEKIADGLGVGNGIISALTREALPGNEDLAQATDEAIYDPRLLVRVDADSDTGDMLDDDGCGDGRSVAARAGAIFTGVADRLRTFGRSLHRAKVFGGGAAMTVAMNIGLGKSAQEPLMQAFTTAIADLEQKHIGYGAHTDNHNHAHDANCGCGAIDKAPGILAAIRDNQDRIAAVIGGAFGLDTAALRDNGNKPGVLGVLENFATAAAQDNSAYAGKNVMGEIAAQGKIVKELDGEHRETRIILNFVEGFTVDQELVREETGGRAQVFAVDVWRLRHLAQKLYGDPAQPGIETESVQRAFVSELVYTLGTAIVLTDGKLPVYAVRSNN